MSLDVGGAMFWIARSRGLGEEAVVDCHSFREVSGEKIPIFFEFVLLLLS
jgi:hypothetical protein